LYTSLPTKCIWMLVQRRTIVVFKNTSRTGYGYVVYKVFEDIQHAKCMVMWF
jgi:hypothetical protein